ncbi:MAG: hypothetical protein JNL81_09225 [Hyphomonadaceae bacterium]|nr:hypothetical protein [Hyphomonadaceae bacterium]
MAFVLTALLAVFLQAFVVQTHVHVSGTTYAAGYTQQIGDAHDLSVDASAGGDHQVSCVICQAMSTAGTAMLPGAAIIAASLQSSADAIIALALAPRVHSHSWRSRAPPSIL